MNNSVTRTTIATIVRDGMDIAVEVDAEFSPEEDDCPGGWAVGRWALEISNPMIAHCLTDDEMITITESLNE